VPVSAEVKEVKRTKRVRRNYQREMERLVNYCEARVDVLKKINANPTTLGNPDRWQGWLEAYEEMLQRLNRNGK
jgi:hypothetical protein